MTTWQKIITVVVLIIFVSVTLLYPATAEARTILQKLVHFLKKTTRFLINLPGNIAQTLTRPLGPVLGPIAANMLLANMPNRLVEVLAKADTVSQGISAFESQTNKLNAAKKVLEDRADEVYKDIEELYEIKDKMFQQLKTGELDWDEYKDKVVAFKKIVEAYEETAERLETAAENLKPENLLKQIAGNALKQSSRKIKRIIQRRIGNELKKLINPDLVSKFLGEGGQNVLEVIDLIVAGDSTRILLDLGYDRDHPDFKNLLDKIKADIKEQLKSDRDYLKGNWKQVLEQKIKDILAEYEIKKEEGNLEEFFLGNTNKNTNTEASDTSQDDLFDELLNVTEDGDEPTNQPKELPKDADGCLPGYHYDRKVIGCVQTNCNESSIAHAHISYDGYCVCGSSGSIAEDPTDFNQECSYGKDYATCPGCVYKCEKIGGDCVED
ncbi:hypothetical protein ACFL0L_01740 [Patescibacteria group bacterium]